MNESTDLFNVVKAVVAAFERQDVRYFVTGSFASGVHGEFRATNGIDIVAELDAPNLAPVFEELSQEFIADLDQAVSALESGTSFNLIHRTVYLKVDVFPAMTGFDAEAINRAEPIALPGGNGSLRVATREDILLAKLRWYRLGGETSETQRRDIRRLASMNRGEFDERYLRHWAAQLGVGGMLDHFLE